MCRIIELRGTICGCAEGPAVRVDNARCFESARCAREKAPSAGRSHDRSAKGSEGDAAALRDAHSKRLRENAEGKDGIRQIGNWEDSVREARSNLSRLYGDYRIEDFTFTYAGDDTHGKLTVSHEKQKSFEFKVVLEGDAWKLDSH
jgi:hypothetical protein